MLSPCFIARLRFVGGTFGLAGRPDQRYVQVLRHTVLNSQPDIRPRDFHYYKDIEHVSGANGNLARQDGQIGGTLRYYVTRY